MVRRLVIFIVLLLCVPLSLASELTARVDRLEIGIDESVELVVSLADSRGQRPDLTEIYKDFSIDQHSQSSNLTVYNGVRSLETRWTFLLSPNRKGKLTIPSLKVGNLKTDPIEITVGDNPVAQSSSDDLLMEVEVRPVNPYVRGQIIYIQRLYYSRPLIDNASISRPKISKGQADVEYLGASNPRYVQHNGRPYQLRENYYALFPSKAGPLHIEPSVFRGSLASSRARQNRFSMPFNSGTRVNAYSAKAELTIMDQPASFSGESWLPASQVNLNMNWSIPPANLKAGEPAIVTIALMAEGTKAELLPEVKLALPDSLKVYPEQPSFRSDKGGSGLAGLREEKFTIIGNEAGEYQIPAVEVPWWNTNTDKQEIARLASFTIRVDGSGVIAEQVDPKTPEPVVEDKTIDPVQPAEEESADLSPLIAPVADKTITDIFVEHRTLTLAGAVSMLALLLGWYIWRRRSVTVETHVETSQDRFESALTQLTTASRENHAVAAINTLPIWAREVGIYPATLAGVQASGDEALSKAVRDLNRDNFSQTEQQWNGEALAKAISAYSADYSSAQSGSAESAELAPLHPIS